MSKSKTVLVLRSCAKDLKSHNGFQWPESGPVKCPDWDATPKCGGGLHGLLWGQGDQSLVGDIIDDKWLVVEVLAKDVVKIDGGQKVKFPKGNVIFCGDYLTAEMKIIAATPKKGKNIASGNYSKAASSGYGSKAASSGNYSTAASSGYGSKAASSGDCSKAASSGNYSKAASSGDGSTAASSGNYSKAASSGNGSTAASSGNYSKAASSGNCGIAAVIGNEGRAKAGPNGLIILCWWDNKHSRYRCVSGNVGEAGIKADTMYCLNGMHELEEVR